MACVVSFARGGLTMAMVTGRYPANGMVPSNTYYAGGNSYPGYQRISQAYGEDHYTCATRRALQSIKAGKPSVRAYAYTFAYASLSMGQSNATHTSELKYVGSSPSSTNYTQEEAELRDTMRLRWIQFQHGLDIGDAAVTQDSDGDHDALDMPWPEYSPDDTKEMLWTTDTFGGPRAMDLYSDWPGNPVQGKDTCAFFDANFAGGLTSNTWERPGA